MSRWPEEVDNAVMQRVPDLTPEEEQKVIAEQRFRALLKDAASILFIVLGTSAGVAGAAMLWGPGASLLFLAGVAIAVGIVLGI